ncbi:uncharacterized protein LOC6536214 [Drosophila yakuba]|uniref:MYND-type domain-containing protein n=1 Tax=Drosophila yakuba TaxID=7245 RepID=B4PT56_DROYA|nr:uncharacterized protein LOC6536214 [Drosophila yakuba]EDW96517.2 uncharacterized protein Dyak_GE24851 [Drosophila yakuba]
MQAQNAVAGAQLAKAKGKCVYCAVAAERICQRCGDFYCSKDCQRKDWLRHRYICIPLPALVYPNAYNVFQSDGETTLEGSCSVNADKSAVEASPLPINRSAIIPDLKCDNAGSIRLTAANNDVPIPLHTSNSISSRNNDTNGKQKTISPPNANMPPSGGVVYIAAFSSSNRCYIRDASESADIAFVRVCQQVNTTAKNLPKINNPPPVGFCLARHNDKYWRARVWKSGKQKYCLLLVDLGIVKPVTSSDLKAISFELLSLPCFLRLVQLKNVLNYDFSNDVIAFHSQFVGKKYMLTYIKSPGCYYVDLVDTLFNSSVNEKIRAFIDNMKSLGSPNSGVKNETSYSSDGPQPSQVDQAITISAVESSQAVSQSAETMGQKILQKPEEQNACDKKKDTLKQHVHLTGQESIYDSDKVDQPEPQIDPQIMSDAYEREKNSVPDDHLKNDLIKRIIDQGINKLDPREIVNEHLLSHKSTKDANIQIYSTDVRNDNGKVTATDNKTIEQGTEGASYNEVGFKDENKPTFPADRETKTTPNTASKPKDQDIKQFLTQCLSSKTNYPIEFPNIKEQLENLSFYKTSAQENEIVMPKIEPVLKPPFELRRFSIETKEGIDVFVVDSSKKYRGIFGAFDSNYASEFSTLHSRLSEITDCQPYKPVLREYVLARFEGSWYRGKVEQIIVVPQQQTKYRVMYLDYTNVEDITETDIRRFPSDLNTPCATNLCVIDEFPHKLNAAQISYLSEALKVHQLVHIESVNYLNHIAVIKSRSLIQKLLSLSVHHN